MLVLCRLFAVIDCTRRQAEKNPHRISRASTGFRELGCDLKDGSGVRWRMVPADKCALIVPLDVEPQSLAAFRARHILTPAVSLPAHVTLRGPLPPLDLLDTTGLSEWSGRVRGFDFELSATERFEGAGVIYLVPDPAQRFRELALELTALYPDPPSPFSEPVMLPVRLIPSRSGGDEPHARIAFSSHVARLGIKARSGRAGRVSNYSLRGFLHARIHLRT